MHYISLAGNWLKAELLRMKPPEESTGRFLRRCVKALQKEAHVDPSLLRGAIETGGQKSLPLFVVALIARWVGCPVERLAFGAEQPEFDDPFLEVTEADLRAVKSANNFVDFLKVRDVLFPAVLWDYAFPVQRRGDLGELTVEQWEALYLERFGEEPPYRR